MKLETAAIGAWGDLPFFHDTLPGIEAALASETRRILPAADQVFAALALTQPEAVRVVILGQDPYPTPGHAHGLAFSADADTRPLPRSLSNIFKEMREDLGASPEVADLHFWARQGVLLLNSVLTVPAGVAGGHSKLGWQALTRQVLARLSEKPCAFLLWGRPAQAEAASSVTGNAHLKIETAHPSPLSARRGFFGSRPFSRTNAWLTEHGHAPINWTNPEAAV
ncbi:uracil-DNA glycosylase [Tropicimonas sp. IMCC6043]|uniref:uracil-DNA glycosylase n=1 Tax=Tropicimonas sp. IMCC6043 TaxID=2510645 RepID=UPI00101D22E3|nr:uracil-DNA glycosylase [Tropicimonas sp. IMCC6043]RYH10158.1 uracil-DNA glycosylase [Tropicimonas sp. IMCC6043]